MSEDMFIGFKEEPKELTDFLAQQGYVEESRVDEARFYSKPPLDLYYYPHAEKAEDDEEVPNWEKSGFKIVSELNINYPNEHRAVDEAKRLLKDIVQRFDGVFLDNNIGEYFTKEAL